MAPRKSAALRIVEENQVVATPVTKPIPAGVDWAIITQRGYHVLWGKMWDWQLDSFLRHTIKHHLEKVMRGDYSDDLLNDQTGGYVNVPIQFVKDAPAKSTELFVPITTADELRTGVVNFRRDHNEYDPFMPRDITNDNVSLHVGKDEWFKAEMFADAGVVFPAEYALAYHITRRKVVGFASWSLKQVKDDRTVSAAKSTLKAAPKKDAWGRVKPVAKAKTTGKAGSLVIDTKGLLVFGKLTAADKATIMGTMHDYRMSLDGYVSSSTTVVFSNVVLADENQESVAATMGLTLDEEGYFSGYWKPKSTTRKGFVLSTGKLDSVDHFMRIRKAMSEDDYAKAWMQRFMEKGAKEVLELEKKQLKLQQDMLGVSKQLGDSRFMQDLMAEGGLNAFKGKLKSLATVPGIETVAFLPDGIALTTEEMIVPFEGKSHFLGRFYVILDLMGNKVTIQNLLQGGSNVHPMVGSGGYFCLGSYSGILSQALATSDYEILAMTMLEFLRDSNGLTSSGKSLLRSWATERPANGSPGTVIVVYQGTGGTAIGNGYDDEDED